MASHSPPADPLSPSDPPARTLVSIELYDLESDPHEQNNLAEIRPDLAVDLLQRLDAWEEEYGRNSVPNRQTVDTETLEQLRSLGYVQ